MHASLLMKITAILMVVLTVFALASCSIADPEDGEETTTEPEVVTLVARPEDEAQILDFFNTAVNAIKPAMPGVKRTYQGSVKNVEAPDSPETAAMIQFAKTFATVLEKVSETREYGENLDDFLPLKGSADVSRLTMEDIVSATIEDVEDDRYVYDVVVVLKDSDANGAVNNAFDMETIKSDVLNTFTDYKKTVEVSDYEVTYTGCEIRARINKETNNVLSLTYVKNSSVTATVNFTGALSEIGETDVSFVLTEETSFNDFVWEEPTEAPVEG